MRGALDGLGARTWVGHPAGSPALRSAIADWLSTSRGLAVAPEQVILVNGRQQALHIAAHLALRPGARAVVEDPCDPDAAATLAGEAAELVRVPVDADGLRTDRLPSGEAALVHVTPEHHRPLGVRPGARPPDRPAGLGRPRRRAGPGGGLRGRAALRRGERAAADEPGHR